MGRPVIVIPVKPFAEGKSRLSGVLDDGRREGLSRWFYRHVLDTAMALADEADVLVVSRDAQALQAARDVGATALHERCNGHNPALAQALLELDARHRAPVLIVSSDLPLLTADDLRAMLAPPAGVEVMIATDRAGTGTNALYLARPTAMRLCFGPGSRHSHEKEGRRRGVGCRVIERAGLACDIDEAADLALLPPAAARQLA